MKRFNAWLLAASLLLVAVPAFADWEATNVLWLQHDVNVPGGVVGGNFTTFAASKVDTSLSFTLADADPLSLDQMGQKTAGVDTVHFARLVIYADSSTAATVNFKASTCAIQANFGDQNASWQTAFTVTSSVTDGQKAWVIPLGALAGNDGSIDLTSKLAIVGPRLRVIVTGGASVAGNAMRIKLFKWKN